MPRKVLFIIGAMGSAYEINFNGIKKHMEPLGYVLEVVSCYDILETDLSKYTAVFAMTWMDARVESVIRKYKGIKCAIVGSHVHIDRDLHGMLRHYDSVFCVSPRLQFVLKDIGYPATVVHYFYSSEIFYPSKIQPPEFKVGWAGNSLRDVKRFKFFQQAVYRLDGIVGFPVIMNTDKVTVSGAQRLVVSPELTQEQMGDYYRELSCYVVCSETEGQPKTGIEAMLCGLPVISTDVGVMSELGAFILPEPLTIESLRLVLKRIYRDDTQAKLMGIKSRQLSIARFDERKVLCEWEKIFESVTDGTKNNH